MQVIIDFDGTLTAEETQAETLKEKSLQTLANEIVGVSGEQLALDYTAMRRELLQKPWQHWWEVNGLVASYCDEGAFILNTTTLQTMLHLNPAYTQAVNEAFPNAEYDPVMDCINTLFHRHTAEMPPAFRPAAADVLNALLAHPTCRPVILTNSLGDKVQRQLGALSLDGEIDILGDTRQYAMDPDWDHYFTHPKWGSIQIWPLSKKRKIDLRRPAYYNALRQAQTTDSQVVVVADTLSLPGALPLTMGIPFVLIRTSYTPDWCLRVVAKHPLGVILDDLAMLPEMLVPTLRD
ncbi:MAG: hypothetical protein JXA89_22755 [Anaerolineae bacterium]|nr:hypothetical protein [Anaerolineae bacterium]